MRFRNRPIAVTALAVAGFLLCLGGPGAAGAADSDGRTTAESALETTVRWHGAYCRPRSGEGWRHATAFAAAAATAGWVGRRRRLTS